jgi:hypothetical protein
LTIAAALLAEVALHQASAEGSHPASSKHTEDNL